MTTFVVQHQIQLLIKENFNDWLINIQAYLRLKKLWQCTQTASDDKESQKKIEQTTNIMTLTISVDVKQKLIKKNFNNNYKMFKHLEVLLSIFYKCKIYAFNEEILHAVIDLLQECCERALWN